MNHLRTGVPLPEKPVVLTFDDGYVGHYDYVYKLAKYYNYPVAFSIFTDKVDGNIVGRCDSGMFAGESDDLLTIERFGESRFDEVIESAWGGPPLT
ncbi:MAG: polysaccharide deacetylase family protein, partial [Cyanobacteria bacterium P01_F01_bin.116]